MKIKLSEALILLNGINAILSQPINSGKFAYTLSEKQKELQPKIESLNTARTKVCENHCIKDENNKPVLKNGFYEFGIDVQEKVKLEIEELFNQEIEFEWNTISIEHLDKTENLKYVPEISAMFGKFITK